MIKLRVFKKGPTYHRHTQKKTWAVFFFQFPGFFCCVQPKTPKKKRNPPANVGPRIHRHWPRNRRDLSKLPNCSDQPRRNVPRKGFSRGAGWRLSSLNSMSAWRVNPRCPNRIFCRTYVQGIVLIPTKKHSEVMGVYSFMQLQSFLIKRYHT